MLHETYEIIHETLWDMNSGDGPDRKVCRETDRFAAAVLMQPEAFASMAEASGLVTGHGFRSVSIREFAI